MTMHGITHLKRCPLCKGVVEIRQNRRGFYTFCGGCDGGSIFGKDKTVLAERWNAI
jgi:hypothetical protein